jgi:hypothetical protein
MKTSKTKKTVKELFIDEIIEKCNSNESNIRSIVDKFPNDQELGREIRKYFNKKPLQ